jgi:hypothetical protein
LVGALVALGSGWSEGRWMAAVVSQVALSRTTREPTSYLRRVSTDQPFLAADGLVSSGKVTNLQPAGNDGTQGTSEADGTDWAISHNGSRSAAQSDNPVLGRILGAAPLPVVPHRTRRDHAWNRPMPRVTTPIASNSAAR